MRPAHYHDARKGDVSWLKHQVSDEWMIAQHTETVRRFGGDVFFVPRCFKHLCTEVGYLLCPSDNPRGEFAYHFRGWVAPPPLCDVHPTARVDRTAVLGREGFGFARAYARGSTKLYRMPHVGGVIIDAEVEIGAHACVDRGCLTNTRIMRGSKIDNLVHVAHGVVIEPNCWVAAGAVLCGSSRLEEGVEVGVNASILPGVIVRANARVGAGAVVTKYVAPGTTVVGNPAQVLGGQGGRSE